MSELWRFVYIASYVTLHVKPDTQKVNWEHKYLNGAVYEL